ncbi:unnamed protein product [Orchesella dallaii]|uniref:Uncharacterized protein n=1 Tax=Orchesella dallaii TaxID=48710 RepID=A0ABP1RT30_9HEXA
MALSQSTITFFAVIAIMALTIEAVPIDTAKETGQNAREGRFYGYPAGGVAGSSANAFAASNSGGFGGGFGGGLSSSQSFATANSGASGIGFPYGK